MTDLLTLTLNPALDLSSTVAAMVPGPKLRLDAPLAEPGGGGINVARAAIALGGQARALALLGGMSGQRIADLLGAEGVPLIRVPVKGETRQSLAVTDQGTGAMYRLQFPGPQWDRAATPALIQTLVAEAQSLPGTGVVVLSGSQPPGLADEFPAQLAAVMPRRLVIDTSGPPLARLVQQPAPIPPAVLRMDEAEAAFLAGAPLADVAATRDLAAGLVARGVAGCVVMARGAEGSVLVAPGLALHCQPPLVPVASKIGAGDSFTAAFALAMARGQGWPEALVAGTAAAAAAVMTPGSALCRRADAERLAAGCRLSAA